MGRHTGARAKICRRLGLMVFENSNVEKAFLKRESVQFGRKQSEYGRRLVEKQKIMHYYGIREKQMRLVFGKARRQKGDTGRNFIILLERRLDNVICAAGLATSRAAARQLITHGHVLVNDKRVTIPSIIVEATQTITFRDKEGTKNLVKSYCDQRAGHEPPAWILADQESRTIKIARLPERDDARLPVEEQLVVEFYSR